MSYQADSCRLEFDVGSKNQAVDARTSATPQLWKAVDWNVDVMAFKYIDGVKTIEACDLWVTLLCTIKQLNDPAGVAVEEITLSSGFDNATTLALWDAETKQHARFPFTAAEADLDLGSALYKDFLMIVHGTTTTKTFVLGTTTLRVYESGL